jgi:hypothetical protein
MPKKEKKKDVFDEAIEKAELIEAERKRLDDVEKEEKLAYIG